MKRILVIGATSAIAEACARQWAVRGEALAVAGRSLDRTNVIAADLKIRGASGSHALHLDVLDASRYEAVVQQAVAALGGLDIVLMAHGVLPDQAACEADPGLMRESFEVNALSVLALGTLLANVLAKQGHGTLAVIGSVAGDRGRASNYVYGAAKATVAVFLQGLRQRLARHGVQVLTIKPGFVDTPMTQAFSKGILWAQPDKVARDIVRAVDHGKDVLYTPAFWRFVMLVIRAVPERIFKRLSL